jgi:phage FluMu protein Com
MQLDCPRCGGREIRLASLSGAWENFKSLFGFHQIRCRRCEARWQTSMWEGWSFLFAKCPRCYRQRLTYWDRSHYIPSSHVSLMLKLGANPVRCAACRHNFASFLPRRERFKWNHQERPSPTPRDVAPVDDDE